MFKIFVLIERFNKKSGMLFEETFRVVKIKRASFNLHS